MQPSPSQSLHRTWYAHAPWLLREICRFSWENGLKWFPYLFQEAIQSEKMIIESILDCRWHLKAAERCFRFQSERCAFEVTNDSNSVRKFCRRKRKIKYSVLRHRVFRYSAWSVKRCQMPIELDSNSRKDIVWRRKGDARHSNPFSQCFSDRYCIGDEKVLHPFVASDSFLSFVRHSSVPIFWRGSYEYLH